MGILYPLEDYHIWANRYDIEIKTIRCEKCGKAITTSKLFALGKVRRFISEKHGCEEKCLASVVFYGESLKKLNVYSIIKRKVKIFSKLGHN